MKEIKMLRVEKGLTQEQLAQLCGVTTVTINRAERKGNMRHSTYIKIMEVLKNENINPIGTPAANASADSSPIL